MVSRVERTPFATWWWTVDRLMLAALIVLMLGGIVLSLAASPPVAARLGLEPFYFVNRHVLYLFPALAVLLTTALLPERNIRRVALVVFFVSLLLIVATLITGALSDIWPDGTNVDQYMLPDMMVTNVCFGGKDLRTAYATLSMGGTLVSFEWPRPGLPLRYLNR